jgi:hypothetical protein
MNDAKALLDINTTAGQTYASARRTDFEGLMDAKFS